MKAGKKMKFSLILSLNKFVQNTSVVSLTNSKVDTHTCNLRDAPAARF